MGIEDMYARRMSDSGGGFNGYSENDKLPKLQKTSFKVGDEVVVRGKNDGVDYLKGKIISLVRDMHIEGEILQYSKYIRYPKGTYDVFIMCRDGRRHLNGMDFITVKC